MRGDKLRLFQAGLFLFTILFFNIANAEPESIRVTLGTATKGGGFQLFGQNLAEVINATDPGLQIQAIATKGSKQNLPF